jgi:hypothetical protein
MLLFIAGITRNTSESSRNACGWTCLNETRQIRRPQKGLAQNDCCPYNYAALGSKLTLQASDSVCGMKRQPPVNPLGPVLLAFLAFLVVGAIYEIFGIGKDALIYTISAIAVFGLPVVIVFGVTGIVLGVRRLLRGRKP